MRNCAVVDCFYWLIPRCLLMCAHSMIIWWIVYYALVWFIIYMIGCEPNARSFNFARFWMLGVRAKCFVNRAVTNGFACFSYILLLFLLLLFLFFFFVFNEMLGVFFLLSYLFLNSVSIGYACAHIFTHAHKHTPFRNLTEFI